MTIDGQGRPRTVARRSTELLGRETLTQRARTMGTAILMRGCPVAFSFSNSSGFRYVGQPIQCWIPAQFTGAWEQYSENYCFVQNTYFVNPTDNIPDSVDQREQQEIGYYQWVPFILGIQAILFYLPQLVWRCFNWQSGVSLKSMVKSAKGASSVNTESRKAAVEMVANHIHESLGVQRQLKVFASVASVVHRGGFLTALYLFVKGLYVLQVLAQFVILNRFLSTSSMFWGFGILKDLVAGREWEESGHFPRVTMCDFAVRVLGNKHRHTVQCVLMINMFNEKVYMFLWFWLLGVFIVTLINLIWWIMDMATREKHLTFVKTYLRVFKLFDDEDMSNQRVLNRFVDKELGADGVLILRLISKNAGDIVTTDLITQLWGRHLEEEEKQQTEGHSPALDDVDGFREKAPLT